MELDAEDIARFGSAIERFEEVIDSVSDRRNKNIGNATITVNAGGVGVWVAVTCCLVMLALLLLGSLWASREMNRFDQEMQARKDENSKMTAYLQAIYVQAPQLKPKESTHKNKE